MFGLRCHRLPHQIFKNTFTATAWGDIFWRPSLLLNYFVGQWRHRRDEGGAEEAQRGTERWRSGSRRDREGPVLSDTGCGLCFLGGPEKMQCK